MNKTYLKPCPFCGDIPVVEKHEETDRWTETVYQVVCDSDDCLINPETNSYGDKQRAINDWNTRYNKESENNE